MRVSHPHLKHIQYDVPDTDVDRWVDAGWIPDVAPAPAVEVEQDLWDEANHDFKSNFLEGVTDGD